MFCEKKLARLCSERSDTQTDLYEIILAMKMHGMDWSVVCHFFSPNVCGRIIIINYHEYRFQQIRALNIKILIFYSSGLESCYLIN